MRTIHCLYLFLAGLLLSGLLACNSKPPDAATAEADAFAANNATLDAYTSSKGLATVNQPSGLRYVIIQSAPATAKQAALGDEVEFSYVQYVVKSANDAGTLAVRDSLIDTTHATRPAFVPFFDKALIPGLQEGLLLLREGAKATLLMPARLAFGAQGSVNGTIIANTPVRIDVTLKRSRSETQQINEYIARSKLTVTDSTTSGLRLVKMKSKPTGDSIRNSATLDLRFNGGILRSATAIDSTAGNVTRPYTVGQTASGSILSTEGFRQGLAKLRVGERAILIFPSSLGYTSKGYIQDGTNVFLIAPNAPLRIDVEVVSVR